MMRSNFIKNNCKNNKDFKNYDNHDHIVRL